MLTITPDDIFGFAKKANDSFEYIENKLFPDTRSTLLKSLESFYNSVVDDFRNIYPDDDKLYQKLIKKDKENKVKNDLVRKNTQKIAFYDAQVFMNVFLAYHLFVAGKSKVNLQNKIKQEISKNKNIIFTKQSLTDFETFFAQKLFVNAELRLLLLPFQIDKQDKKINDILNIINKPTEIRNYASKINELSTSGSANIVLNDISNSNISINQIFANSPEITKFILQILEKQNKVKLYNVPMAIDKFTGREEDLRDIHLLLQQNRNILLFKGFGGIGKTTLAIEYCHRQKSEYDHIMWIVFDGDLKSSLSKLANDLGIVQAENFSDVLISKINSLQNVLLIIDNFFIPEKQNNITEELRTFLPNVKKILTAREEIKGKDWIITKEIDKLSPTEAKKMFVKYCGFSPNEKELDDLMKTVDYHTLTLELSAKLYTGYSNEITLTQLTKSFGDINQEIADIKTNTNYADELKINNYLKKLFNLSKLTEPEIEVLRQFAVLQPDYMPYDELKEIIIPENKIKYTQLLNDLSAKSWLQTQTDNQKKYFRCPPVIQNFIKQEYKPVYEFYKNIIQNLIDLLYKKPTDNPVDKFKWLPYGFILQNLEEENEKIAASYNNISLIYRYKGDYEQALEFAFKSLKIKEKVLDNEHPDLATSYNNISLIYQAKGDYEQALEFALKDIKISEKVLGNEHPSLATSYNNIAYIYEDLKDKKTAYEYICKAVEIWEKKLPANHPDLISAKNFKKRLENEIMR